MNNHSSTAQQEQAWVQALANEARRDLVFLWHITEGRFGRPSYESSELHKLVERVASALLDYDCIVGFGDPDSVNWRVPSELAIASAEKGKCIAHLWQSEPDAYQFLVFALRQPEPPVAKNRP